MTIGNRGIALLLRSPLHPVLSGSFDLVRYQGRRSGATFTTPTQYASRNGGIIIMVGSPERKQWWRNFRGGHDLDVLLSGQWVPMRGTAIVGAEDPGAIAPLLASYRSRFRRVARHLRDGTTDPRAAVVVWCRPRLSLAGAPDAAQRGAARRSGATRAVVDAERTRPGPGTGRPAHG